MFNQNDSQAFFFFKQDFITQVLQVWIEIVLKFLAALTKTTTSRGDDFPDISENVL